MKLTKTKLKQIIKQEVIKKLLEQDDEKFKPPGRSRRDFLKGLGAAAAVGTGARTLSKMVDADKEARAADRNKHAEEQYKKAYSFDKKASEFNEYVNNPAAFRWARGEGSMMQLPGSIKKDEHGIPRGITVLPASYSIAVLAYNDKLNGRNKFPPPSSQVSFTKSADGAGASESMKYFFDEFKDSFIDANLAFDVPGIQQLPAQGLERGILMINPNTLMSDPEYVLPENGLTVREYYNWLYYNQFLSIDEVLVTDYESIDGERMRSLLDSATPGQWKQALRK